MKRMIKKCFLCLMVLAICMFFTSCMKKMTASFKMNKTLDALIQSDVSFQSSYVLFNSILYADGQTEMRLDNLLDEATYDFKEFLVGLDGFYYTVYTSNQGRDWHLVKISRSELTPEILYTISYDETENHVYQYGDWRLNQFSEQRAFYHEGKIVLSNGERVFEYAIEENTCVEYLYNEYEFPINHIKYEYLESDVIRFTIDEKEYICSFEKLAEKNAQIQTLYAIPTQQIYSGITCEQYFLDSDSVQIINGEIYILGYIFDYRAGKHIVIMHYDPIVDDCVILDHAYTGADFEELYLVNIKE